MAVDTGIIVEVFTTVTAHAMAMVPKLQDAGIRLLMGLAAIMIAWTAIKEMLADNGVARLMVEIMSITLQVGIVYWIIIELVPLSSALLAGFDWVAARLTGAADGANALKSGMAGLMQVSQNLWQSIGQSEGDPSAWDVAKEIFKGGGTAMILKLFTLIVLLLITVIVGAIFIISQILAGVGIALAPVFLPFFVVPALSKMADGIILFIFKAGVMKTIAVVMISFIVEMTGLLNRLTETWANAASGDAQVLDLTATTMTLFVAVVTLFLSLQIPNIANGLLSGSVVGGLSIPRIPKPGMPKTTSTSTTSVK